MKVPEENKIGASAKRWREVWEWLFKPPVTESSTEVEQRFTQQSGVHCCRCERPIPEEEWAVSKWGNQYICEKCYYQEEFVAMRDPTWSDLGTPRYARRATA